MTAKISLNSSDLPNVPVTRLPAIKSDKNTEYVGKVCPYCHNAIKSTSDIVVCSTCDTPHHKDCWSENGGCTTYGCTGDNAQDEIKNTTSNDTRYSNSSSSANWVSWTFFGIAGVIAFGMMSHFNYAIWSVIDVGIIIVAIIAGLNSLNKT